MKVRIDECDKRILRLLQEDGNLSQKQIAYRLHKSLATICERIKRLTNQGFIVGKHVVINRKLLNLEVHGFIDLNLEYSSEKEMEQFTNAVTKISGVFQCLKVIGRLNTKLEIVTVDITAMSRIHDQVSNLDHVSDSEISIVAGYMIEGKGIDF